MQQIKTVGGAVQGSNYTQSKCRNEIHALIFENGLPSIFVTINPADVHSRIALYFAGVEIDVNEIFSENMPTIFERASIIAKNSVATARFFNKLITTLFETLICPKDESMGVLGPVHTYYGTVGNFSIIFRV